MMLVTGGLGPTKDDITKKTICEFFEDILIEDKDTLERVTQFFQSRNLPMLEVNTLQAMVPSKCHVIPNFNGTAPGMWLEKNGHFLISMPGVPYEMKGMMSQTILPKIAQVLQLPSIFHHTIMTVGVGESFIADQLSSLEEEITSAGIALAYLPSPGIVKLRLSSYGHQTDANFQSVIERYADKIEKSLGDIVYAHTDVSLQSVVSQLLQQHQKTISIAESCTGGMIQSWLTSIEGASQIFNGGITPYLKEIKHSILGVDADILAQYDAVSEPVATAMALACKQIFQSDYAIATTGYAGPGNEESEIPVGTVFIALATPENVTCHQFQLGKNRERNIRMASLHALNLLRLNILNK
jgi:nicotinamide-nucleotide amidase